MPFRDDPTRLGDILAAILLIEKFIAGMDFEVYSRDEKTKSAVERQLLTLSEAAKALGDRAEALCPVMTGKGFAGWVIFSVTRITGSTIGWCGIRRRGSCLL